MFRGSRTRFLALIFASAAFAQQTDMAGSDSMFQNNPFGDLGGAMSARKRLPMNNLPRTTDDDSAPDADLGASRRSDKVPPAPLPPNLFQLFIQRSTGRLLPIYGQNYFGRADAFSEPSSTPVPADYVVGPGDEILLKIYGGSVNFDQRATVSRDGMITLPKIGPVSVAGVKISELDKHLKKRISRVISNFNLFVTMGQLRGIEVYVVGQARQPGKYVVGGLSTVISALFATGGPSNNGSLRKIQLVRAGKTIATVDLYDFLGKGDTSQDPRLLSGDVISIPPVGAAIAMKGAVPNPAVFELPGGKNVTLKDILPLAGGTPSQVSPRQVTLERISPDKDKPMSAQKIALDDAGLATPLKDGDILTFFSIKADFENAITLRILDEDPIRIPVTEETRVKDVIPSRDFLMTRQYFMRKYGYTCIPEAPPPTNPQVIQLQTKNGVTTAAPILPSPGATPPPVPLKPDAPLNCFPTVAEGTPLTGPNAKPLDSLSRIRLNNQLDQVNWEQAIVERPNLQELTTEVIPFNLGKAIAGEEGANVALKPGDTVTVSGRKDIALPESRQTKIVRIQGEINSPGIYQIEPGETIASLVKRAGSLTPSAYVYGTIFSRQSVKERQKDNLQVVIRRIQAQLEAQQTQMLAAASGSTEMSQASALNTQYAQNARAQIERLKTMTPNGRIALEIDPTDPEYPEFRLEDGDEISIPTKPDYVSVVGAVHNENVLIFHKGNRASDYLSTAGVAEYAEASETFIVRADGSIEPPNARRARVYPGDTIVVPEKFYKESGYSVFMKGLKDWTQVFFQLGLGAAAIHTLGK